MFIGGSTVNLDAKGRLALPTRYRGDLMERCDGQVVMTVHSDSALMLFPRPDWDDLERKLVRLPNQNRLTRELQLMLFGNAAELEVDKNGRVLIPPHLRKLAGLEKRVMFLGMGNKFEIWNEELWEKKCGDYMTGSGDSADVPDALRELTI
ncbi:MAG: division/cell wall cluster transcriptional repressor MraZ [Gammaproteobacteria bacterium]